MMTPPEYSHAPILPNVVVEFCAAVTGATVLDGTLGLGGHTEALLEANPTLRVIGVDRDASALAVAEKRLQRYQSRVRLVHGNYRDIASILDRLGIDAVDAILLDIGVSSMQLDDPERGFSFRATGPLDMRMDRSSGIIAQEWLESSTERELVDALRRYGEERYAPRIARGILAARKAGPIDTPQKLRDIVHRSVPGSYFAQRIDPATRTFQAVRIALNEELSSLEQGLSEGFERLAIGGVFVVITFHSLEDRMVKRFFRHKAAACVCPPDFPECRCNKVVEAEILTKRPLRADESEVEINPRARSAKLRAARKVS